jgi:hypothetical protein
VGWHGRWMGLRNVMILSVFGQSPPDWSLFDGFSDKFGHDNLPENLARPHL